METATILSIFISSLLLGITGYSIYTAFGPNAKNLRDPFEGVIQA
nr:photosystem II protein N [Rhodella violacea]UNJ18171.1 photosystem II protein N [Rhodella violacea]